MLVINQKKNILHVLINNLRITWPADALVPYLVSQTICLKRRVRRREGVVDGWREGGRRMRVRRVGGRRRRESVRQGGNKREGGRDYKCCLIFS